MTHFSTAIQILTSPIPPTVTDEVGYLRYAMLEAAREIEAGCLEVASLLRKPNSLDEVTALLQVPHVRPAYEQSR